MSVQNAVVANSAADARTQEAVVHRYTEMLRIRRFEESSARAYTQGKISGFLHLYIGQEAIAVATKQVMQGDDRVVTTYRDHGFALALGSDSGRCMAEMYGKKTGIVEGNGGSMHFFDREHGLWGGYAIVGGHIPIATGHAYADKYKGEDNVTYCFMGDGALPIGAVHEGFNLAALWDLPIVFVIENNQYSMGTPLSRTHPIEDLSLRADGYGMARDRFRVTDVFETEARLRAAADRARKESKPTLIEMVTYRFRGHSMSDPAKYRNKDEVSARRATDPLEVAEQWLRKDYGFDDDALEAIDDKVVEEMDAAVEFAENSPFPDPEDRFNYGLIEDEG